MVTVMSTMTVVGIIVHAKRLVCLRYWAQSPDIAALACDVLSMLVSDRFDDNDDCATGAWLAAQ